MYSHFAEAGLLSIPVMSARVESATISLLALDSHSIVISCSPVCFTSTIPITCRESPSQSLWTRGGETANPHDGNPVCVTPFLDPTKHPLQMPPDKLPPYPKNELLTLRHDAR